MEKTNNEFYFYDLETTGLSAREDRIMQFAGQRTTKDLEPIGEPDNIFIKLTPDILPSPDAVMVTGITPQKTLQDGISEVEFLNHFYEKIAKPGTVFTGFNTIRFDDEFMRFLNYRNFYDAYEWQWSDDRGKWDVLDVVRMTRALRPDGIKWPFNSEGKPVNKLELLTELNNLQHENAHDAVSDVIATIAVAKLVKQKQPKLFEYLYNMRSKKSVENLVSTGQPFVYTSGMYDNAYEKTTVAVAVGQHPNQPGTFIVYDLRYDPSKIVDMPVNELLEMYEKRFSKDSDRLPFKLLHSNKCPSVAPLNVLNNENKQKLSIGLEVIEKNYQQLQANPGFGDKLGDVFVKSAEATQAKFITDNIEVDSQLYDGFFNGPDKTKMRVVRSSNAEQLADLNLDFTDPRLSGLLTLYKARQFANSLNPEEEATWRDFCKFKLLGGSKGKSKAEKYFKRLEELAEINHADPEKVYLLEELQLYGQSILPEDY